MSSLGRIKGRVEKHLWASLLQLLQGLAHIFRAFRSHGAADFNPVFKRDQSRPKLDAKGAAQWAPRAVFNFDVFDAVCFVKRCLDMWSRTLAIAAPTGAKFQEHGAPAGINFFASGSGILVFAVHAGFHCN
jgi:hypothetical protein